MWVRVLSLLIRDFPADYPNGAGIKAAKNEKFAATT